MRISKLKKIFISCVVATFTIGSYAKNIEKNFPGQLSVEILQAPTPLVALNKYYLVYELHLTNYQSTPITLLSLIVQGDDNQRFEFKDKELEKMVSLIGLKELTDARVLQPGMSKILLVWLPFNTIKNVPNSLTHEVSFALTHPIPFTNPQVKTDSIMIDKTLPLVISAPLHGDNWVTNNGPSQFSEHRKANIVFNGHDYFAQRYAIDFLQVGKNGITSHGDKSKNANYFCYGAPVYAVAAGRVIQLKNDISDNIPQSNEAKEFISKDKIAGNYILLDIGGGKYAFYGHLMPGSLKIKKGSVVKEGQIIAKIGNSGNSSEPHLHFQIIDRPYPFAANGIPYLFHSFYVKPAKYTSDTNNQIQMQFLSKKPEKYIDQIALENTMVSLPNYKS